MRKILAFLIITLFLGSFSYALAQDSDETPLKIRRVELEASKEARSASREAKRTELQQAKCERIQGNIEKRIAKYTAIRARRVKKYAAMKARWLKLANLLEEKRGIDTGSMETAVNGLQPLIDNYLAKLDAFIAKLESVRDADCSTLSDNSRSHVQSAKTELEAVKTAQKELGQYFRTNILGAMKTLKQQASTTESSESEE